MRRSAQLVLALAGLALAAVAATISPAAASAASGVVGHVYVNDNTATTTPSPASTATPTARSPHARLAVHDRRRRHRQRLGSQGALQASPDGRYLLAADAGSNEISVLRIKPDGSLDRWRRTGRLRRHKPVSIAVNGDLVYVANAGDGGSNYTGFTLNAGGHLRPLAGLDICAARWLDAGRRAVQRRWQPPRRRPA